MFHTENRSFRDYYFNNRACHDRESLIAFNSSKRDNDTRDN